MKAQLTFDYDDFDDRKLLKRSLKATDAYIVLHSLREEFRSVRKYNTMNLTDDAMLELGKMEDKLFELMEEHGVDLDDLE